MAGPAERWYVAILVYKSQINSLPDDPDTSIDIQYRLVRAVDAETAYVRSLALGRRGEREYVVEDGICRWIFKGLEDLQEAQDQELGHGAEIYGFIQEGRGEDRVVSKSQLTEFLNR